MTHDPKDEMGFSWFNRVFLVDEIVLVRAMPFCAEQHKRNFLSKEMKLRNKLSYLKKHVKIPKLNFKLI